MASNTGIRNRLAGGRIYYGWFIVVACFLSSTTTFGIIYSFNVFIDPIVTQFESSTGRVSLAFSLSSIVSFGFAAVFGFFVDLYGARRMLLFAGALTSGGLFLVSQAESFVAVVLLYGVVVSIGLGIIYIVAYATVPRWFERRQGIATALGVSGTGIGIILGPPISNYFIASYGWQTAYLVIGLLTLAMVLIAAILVADSPSELDIDYSIEFSDGNPIDEDSVSRDWRTQLADVTELIRKPSLLFIMVGFTLLFFPVYVVLVHVVSHLTNVGVTRETAVLAASMIGAMNMFGKFTIGYVSDRIGEIYAIIGCCLLVSAGTTGYIFVTGAVGMVLTTFIFGLGYGGSAVLISPIVARFFGEIDLNMLTGAVSIGFAISGSLGPYFAGVGFDVFGSYTAPLLLSGVIGLIGAAAFEIAQRTGDIERR